MIIGAFFAHLRGRGFDLEPVLRPDDLRLREFRDIVIFLQSLRESGDRPSALVIAVEGLGRVDSEFR